MRVFLTGGTGLVGSHLAELLRSRGDAVVALQRPGSDTRFLEEIGCRIARGDVQDSIESIARAAEGCDAVVHGAALIYSGLPWSTIHAVNVEGTRRVLEGAARAGVKRILHVSSVATYGKQVGVVDESASTATPIPATDHYARSKREAESAARAVASEHALPMTLIRPAVIYGPRDRLFSPILARVTRLPVIPALGGGRTTLPVVYAGNVASAAALALDRTVPGTGIRIYNLGEDHPIAQRELLTGFARGLGRGATFATVPARFLVGGATMLQRIGSILPVTRDIPVERAARLLTEPNPYRSVRIREELGWHPPFTHAEGIRATTSWLRLAS